MTSKKEIENIAEIPDYEKTFESESIDNAVNQVDIYPSFIAEKDIPYEAKLLTLPSNPFKTVHGFARSIDIEYKGMRMTLLTPNAFLFGLTVQRRKHNLTPNQLIGKTIVFMKSEGKTKQGGKALMFSVQIKD